MATYKIKGQRWLRKYTAKRSSPVYAAAVDAQTVVDSFCEIPWESVFEKDAGMTYHTDEVVDEESKITGLDKNVLIRNSFDAALFCAGHVGGQHRAYANAAVYRYEMPTAAIGLTLSSISIQVTSDPYNSRGVRLHVFTNSTGEIPMNCHTLRGEDSSGEIIDDGTTAAAVAPRTVETRNKTDYWYPTVETATLSPTGGMTLQKYLFVLVALESYSTVRGNWMEGSSFIKNAVEITLSTPVSGWDSDAVTDLSGGGGAFAVCGVLPLIEPLSPTGDRHVAVRVDANLVVEGDGTQSSAGSASVSSIARLFEEFYEGGGEVPVAADFTPRVGASFNIVRRPNEEVPAREYDRLFADTDVVSIDSTVLVIPFVWPTERMATRIQLDFAQLSMSTGARFNVYLTNEWLMALTAEQLKSPGLYDGKGSPFVLLGTITGGTSAEFDAPSSHGRVGTLVISGWMPPEAVNLSTSGNQGTGNVALLPEVSIM